MGWAWGTDQTSARFLSMTYAEPQVTPGQGVDRPKGRAVLHPNWSWDQYVGVQLICQLWICWTHLRSCGTFGDVVGHVDHVFHSGHVKDSGFSPNPYSSHFYSLIYSSYFSSCMHLQSASVCCDVVCCDCIVSQDVNLLPQLFPETEVWVYQFLTILYSLLLLF